MCLGTALVFALGVCLLLEVSQVAGQDQCPNHVSRTEFNITMNKSNKSATLTLEPGHSVNARVGYKNGNMCTSNSMLTIASSLSSRFAVLHVPYFLPCLCVEVFDKCSDSKRYFKCPLANSTVSDVNDVWQSTTVRLKSNSLDMVYKCPAAQLNISTALCWRHGSYCTDVSNLQMLEKVKGRKREYNTSAVDKHPQMCLRRSLQGSYNISCHFEADMSTWMTHIELRRQRILVYINSSVPAKFSAQLCKLSQTTCASMGNTHALNTKCKTAVLHLPVLSVEQEPCVQVWQSDPGLHGRRILCPEYARGRYGIHAVAALVCGIVVVILVLCFYHIIKKDTAGLFYIQRPVLLVCSSEDSVHVSTVCALASILQEDLGATVHLALWAQNTQSPCGMGISDVGPLPWLYGQWDSIVKADGNILIIWSLDAMIAYKNWVCEKESFNRSNGKKITSHASHKTEKTATMTGKHEEQTAQRTITQPSTVIAPVFKAALTYLMGALQANKLQKVAFICLHGHKSRKYIPKAFRTVPRYLLPSQFSGLIQELGVKTRLAENSSRFHCWTGLLSKVLCFWLAQQLARKLETVLLSKKTGTPSEKHSVY